MIDGETMEEPMYTETVMSMIQNVVQHFLCIDLAEHQRRLGLCSLCPEEDTAAYQFCGFSGSSSPYQPTTIVSSFFPSFPSASFCPSPLAAPDPLASGS